MGFLNTILDGILNIVFPAKCILCGQSGADLCLACLLESPAAERESEGWIFPLYDYRHPGIKKSLWLLKYNNKKRLAKIFAEAMYGQILEELSELAVMQNFNEAILMPIPLSAKRYHERGYNQAELICEEIIHLTPPPAGGPSPGEGEGCPRLTLEKNILIKTFETEHQARIRDRRTRLKNIVGSFAIKNTKENLKKIKNRNIILIDDITTTGATLNEAKKVLRKFGARKIIAFTVAH